MAKYKDKVQVMDKTEDQVKVAPAVPTQAVKPTSETEMVNAFKNDFATSVNRVYINSLGKEYGFKEISVLQQKTLTRIMSANENRKDVVYDAQCGIINEVALDETFDIYEVSEFDRIKLMIALYQSNMFQNDVKFTCEHCGTENIYRLDFDNVIKRLDQFDLSDKHFQYENRRFKYDFTVQYPQVRTVANFHKAYHAKHPVIRKQDVETNESMGNMEYINLFLKSVTATNKESGVERTVDLSSLSQGAREQILNVFPQDVLYSDNGVLKFVVEEFIEKMNSTFDKHECYKCRHIHEKGEISNPESFF